MQIDPDWLGWTSSTYPLSLCAQSGRDRTKLTIKDEWHRCALHVALCLRVAGPNFCQCTGASVQRLFVVQCPIWDTAPMVGIRILINVLLFFDLPRPSLPVHTFVYLAAHCPGALRPGGGKLHNPGHTQMCSPKRIMHGCTISPYCSKLIILKKLVSKICLVHSRAI